jgi:cytidylate kinase|tara:strand:+ start:244 stop:483 length:240 start_codon:yes stop_codon:yes gene_type:complete
MKIQVTIKNVYGNELIYPMCKIGKAFADIAKTKTLSIQVLQTIAEMGIDVEVGSIKENDLLKMDRTLKSIFPKLDAHLY